MALAAGLLALGGSGVLFFPPEQRSVLFPAPDLEAIAVDDSLSGGHSFSRLEPGVSALAFTYGLRTGAPYPHAGIKLVPRAGFLDLEAAERFEISLRADAGVALRLAFKSPAPELGRPTDPSAMFYHEYEFSPGGGDTLQVLKKVDLRVPAWWRIRENWPREQELDRFSQVAEIEIMNGFAPGARDSVKAELRFLAAVAPAPWARPLALLLLALGAGLGGLAAQRALRKAPAPIPPSRLQGGGRPVSLPDPELVLRERALAYLKEHYADPDLSLAGLAKGVGLSERAASEVLRAATGTHFKGALNELRLAEAARLLRQKRGVAEVAYAVGFNNPSHFTRAFKIRYGAAPSGWPGEEGDKTGSEV
jgi:AraC-like DNA-binding protein